MPVTQKSTILRTNFTCYVCACGRPATSNCRSHVSERKTLNVTISHHWSSPSATTTSTTVVLEDSPRESSSAAYSDALLNDDDDDDAAADVRPVGWCVGLKLRSALINSCLSRVLTTHSRCNRKGGPNEINFTPERPDVPISVHMEADFWPFRKDFLLSICRLQSTSLMSFLIAHAFLRMYFSLSPRKHYEQDVYCFLPARRYASAVFATATCPSVRPSVCHTPVLYLAERKQDPEMYTV